MDTSTLLKTIEATRHAILDVLGVPETEREQSYALFCLLVALAQNAQAEYVERIVLPTGQSNVSVLE